MWQELNIGNMGIYLCLLGRLDVMESSGLNSGGNKIHLALSLGGNTASLSSWDLLYDTQVLKGVEGVADDTSGSLGVVLSAGGALSVTSSKCTTEGSNTDSVPSVHPAGDRSGLNVVPVLVLWAELLEGTGLAVVHVSWKLNLQTFQ
jgi:hypothetical protein